MTSDAPSVAEPGRGLNVALVSHTDFRGNSAMHVFSLAVELQRLGHRCVVLVPNRPETVHEHRPPSFPVLSYPQALELETLPFADGGGTDLIHAWSPREHVRLFTLALRARTGAPYLVHMEDNEEQIVADELPGLAWNDLLALPDDLVADLVGPHRSHPVRYRRFLEGAAGYTCLIDTLLAFAPADLPARVFWPGFEPEFGEVGDPDPNSDLRAEHGLAPDDVVLFYSGNVHASIAQDVSDLYLAALLARRRGVPVRLVRTGWNHAPLPIAEALEMAEVVLDLGFVPRADLPGLIGMADMLVQPGRSDPFNDCRFPSKLPEYLASGRPVVLPDSNIGRVLTDGVEALKLTEGGVEEIVAAIVRLAGDPALRRRLGEAGRAFAREHLSWAKAAVEVSGLYAEVLARPPPAERPPVPAPVRFPVQLIAFYLPQFHPIPENDAWWGRGFTEWTNVVRAPATFADHDQPRLPTELGFYDLRVAGTLHAQAMLAAEHGVGGFCFYYYWFSGRRLLEKPLDLWLSRGPDFPFCICWANENWSRRWDGSETDVLIENKHAPGDDERFIRDVLPILADPRYIRVDGAPLLHVYRVTELPDPVGTAQTWRRVAAEHGVPRLHLSAVQSFGIGDPRPYGFDSSVEFSPPHVDRRLLDPAALPGVDPSFRGYFEDYVSVAMRSVNADPMDYVRHRGCFPRWDNTPRRKLAGHVFLNDSPKAYAGWLRFLVREALLRADQQAPLVFVNAWNEWAEGAYLEPDETYGRAYLEATYAALCEGVHDHLRGPTPAREQAFAARVSRLPKRRG